MNVRAIGTGLVVAVSCAMLHRGAIAQTPVSTAEVEPNDTYATATPVTMASGDRLTGTTTGSAANGSGAGNTADWFVAKITAPAAVVTRHRLTITTTAAPGHTGALIGRLYQSGAPLEGVTSIQTTSVNTTPARHNQFYTVVPSDTIVDVPVRITGSGSTTGEYRVTLTSEPVTLTPLGVRIASGPVTFTTSGAGHTTDTEMFLFGPDGTLLAASNDLAPSGPEAPASVLSTISASLAPGVYTLGVSTWETAWSGLPPASDGAQSGTMTLSAGVLANTSSGATGDISFLVTDRPRMGGNGVGTPAEPFKKIASKPGPYGVAFYAVTVGCVVDIASAGQRIGADGELTPDDVVVYSLWFLGNDMRADIAGAGQTWGGDGELTPDDLILYIQGFLARCP